MILRGLENVTPDVQGCVLTIGNFDGVHRGHAQIIAQAGMFAEQSKCQVVVMTFDPHPLSIVAPDRAPESIMPLEEKTRCLLQAGADVVVVARSDADLLGMSPEEFVKNVIVEKFKPTHVVEGWSFGFGKDRRGTPEFLQESGQQYGFDTFIVEPVKLQVLPSETVLVTSSLVRRLIRERQVHRAHLCLGRAFTLFGEVEQGRSRGHDLGFPTANLGRIEQLLPGAGVYAGTARVRGEQYIAAISIGYTPTYEGDRLQVEAHLLECDAELYGQPMSLSFFRFLRDQEKFSSTRALATQIEQDVKNVRELVSKSCEAGSWQ